MPTDLRCPSTKLLHYRKIDVESWQKAPSPWDDRGALYRVFGARQVSPAERYTTAGRLLMQMVGSFAEFERAMIRERTQAGLAAARAQGRIGGRRPPPRPPPQAEAARLLPVPPPPVRRRPAPRAGGRGGPG